MSSATLRYWEAIGLLRRQRPGHRVPSCYGIHDLVRLRILAELRRDGAPLQRVRKALRELQRLLPGVLDKPGAWQLAVTSKGQVVRIENDQQLLDLTRRPGQLVWALFEIGSYISDARAAIEGAA